MESTKRKLALKNRLILVRGKLRRFYYGVFRPGYVRESIAKRRGECARCGACCRLAHACLFHSVEDKLACCKAYKLRTMNCRLFPIDEADIRDRDLVMPERPCGFSFEN